MASTFAEPPSKSVLTRKSAAAALAARRIDQAAVAHRAVAADVRRLRLNLVE
jgi:hypothetical protein